MNSKEFQDTGQTMDTTETTEQTESAAPQGPAGSIFPEEFIPPRPVTGGLWHVLAGVMLGVAGTVAAAWVIAEDEARSEKHERNETSGSEAGDTSDDGPVA